MILVFLLNVLNLYMHYSIHRCFCMQQNQLTKKEVEDLLKKGAYGALMEDDRAGEKFCEEDIEHILQQRTHVRHIEPGVKGSTFAKASFNMSTNRSDINIDDPQFWQKWAKKAEIDVNGAKVEYRCLSVNFPCFAGVSWRSRRISTKH